MHQCCTFAPGKLPSLHFCAMNKPQPLDPMTAASMDRLDLTVALLQSRESYRNRTRRENLVPSHSKALAKLVLTAPLLTRPGTVRRMGL